MGWFWPKYIMFQLKKYRGVIFDCTQDCYKAWRKTGLCLQKLTWGIWQIFTRELESLQIATFMASFCLNLKMYELKIYRGGLCHDNEEWYQIWRGIDLTWGIWQILTWPLKNLKNFPFNRLLLVKVYNVWAKKSIEELCLMALNVVDATFDKDENYALKNDMKNLANFYQSMFGCLKIVIWWDPFIQSRKCMSLKFTREFYVMTMKNDAKFEEESTCQFKIDMRNLTNFDPSTRKSQKFAL